MSLEFRHIAHAYGDVAALRDVSFSANPGEITCLLGSSGCGKSTLLNLAAGLLPVQEGSVSVGGEVIAQRGLNPPPEARPVGLVFQDGALFPHMTIAKNIGFGLGKGAGSDSVIEDWLERVGLAGLGARYPHELSGGQQQRAALARAMAPGPEVLLMDEPFASVDIVLRRRLRRDCRRLLREAGTTTILVTHDPEEALDVGDRIAVMEAGRIVQFGTAGELHEAPAAASVGAIFRGAQIVAAEREGDRLRTQFGDWPLECVLGEMPAAQRLNLLVEADRLSLVGDADGLSVRDRQSLGHGERMVLVNHDGAELTFEGAVPETRAQRFWVTPDTESVRAFVRE